MIDGLYSILDKEILNLIKFKTCRLTTIPVDLDSVKVKNTRPLTTLQVIEGSGIGKIEDNFTSANPLAALSYTTNGSPGRPGKDPPPEASPTFPDISRHFPTFPDMVPDISRLFPTFPDISRRFPTCRGMSGYVGDASDNCL